MKGAIEIKFIIIIIIIIVDLAGISVKCSLVRINGNDDLGVFPEMIYTADDP